MDMLYWYEESRIDVYQNLMYFLYQGMKLCGLEAFFECAVFRIQLASRIIELRL